MKIQHYEQAAQQPVTMEGARNCTVRQLVGPHDNAPNFAMRQFEVSPGGHTPKHSHDYEHEIFVIEGEGIAVEGNTEHRLKAGDVVFVRPGDVHQFRNPGPAPLKFLCLVPNTFAGKPATMAIDCARD